MTTDFAYDNSIVLPNTKDAASRLTAADWNQLCDAANSLRTATQAGLWHGEADTFSNPPALSAVNESISTSMQGQRVLSENAGPYIWIRNVEYVNLGDQRFGLVGDGVTDDTQAVQAAINATISSSNSAKKRVLYVPGNVQILLKSAVTVSASFGFTMVGEGKWTSQFIVDPLVPSANGLVVNSSQHVTLEGFALFGKASNPAGKLLYFSYSPIVYATYAINLRELWMSSNDAREAYDYGIYWSDDYGNGSEVNYWGCFIDRFKEAGVILPGSQQKSHCMFGMQINGQWDGVAANANGGKFGVRQGGGVLQAGTGGSFQYYGGGMGYCRTAGFSLEYPNDPIIIDGVQSEGCYRFVDMGQTALANSPAVSVRSCRLDNGGVLFDSAGWVKFAGQGPFEFINNDVFCSGQGGAIPKIRISASGDLTHLRVTSNNFRTANSYSVTPIIQGGSGLAQVELYSNMYRDNSSNIAYRDETLDIDPTAILLGVPSVYKNWRRDTKMYTALYSNFTDAASSQSVVLITVPKGTWIHSLLVHVPVAFAHPTAATITVKVGKTSGGNEYILASNAKTAGAWYGTLKSECGTGLDGSLNQQGDVPAPNATQAIYVTITLNAGNVSALTAGDLRIIMDLEVLPRTVFSP